MRYEDWKSPGNNEDTVTIVRFDLRHITLSIAYQPTRPLSMNEWMQKERATAIINGGYFDNQNNATALVISNGQSYGASYNGFGGMLYVDSHGHINLRSLRQQLAGLPFWFVSVAFHVLLIALIGLISMRIEMPKEDLVTITTDLRPHDLE